MYYTTTIFLTSGFNQTSAFGASVGFGMINCIFALPAVYTIDKVRRTKQECSLSEVQLLTVLRFPNRSVWSTNSSSE